MGDGPPSSPLRSGRRERPSGGGESIPPSVRLRVVGGRLAVLDLEPLPTLPISPSPISPSLILPSSKPFALVSLISLILIMKHQSWVVR
jgi:hypothetical protein